MGNVFASPPTLRRRLVLVGGGDGAGKSELIRCLQVSGPEPPPAQPAATRWTPWGRRTARIDDSGVAVEAIATLRQQQLLTGGEATEALCRLPLHGDATRDLPLQLVEVKCGHDVPSSHVFSVLSSTNQMPWHEVDAVVWVVAGDKLPPGDSSAPGPAGEAAGGARGQGEGPATAGLVLRAIVSAVREDCPLLVLVHTEDPPDTPWLARTLAALAPALEGLCQSQEELGAAAPTRPWSVYKYGAAPARINPLALLWLDHALTGSRVVHDFPHRLSLPSRTKMHAVQGVQQEESSPACDEELLNRCAQFDPWVPGGDQCDSNSSTWNTVVLR